MKKTQKQRIIEALRANPEGLSLRYIKREMGITEANGRISELRSEGYNIQPIGEDEYGFTIQQLHDEPKKRVQTVEPVLDEAGRQIAVRVGYRYE